MADGKGISRSYGLVQTAVLHDCITPPVRKEVDGSDVWVEETELTKYAAA